MKFSPTACWRRRTSPVPGAGRSTASYTRASGPPTLCTCTALVIATLLANSLVGNEVHRGCVVNSTTPKNTSARWLTALLAVAFGEHVEELDRRGERDREIDVAARDVEFESVGDQCNAYQDQERQRQHFCGWMLRDEPRNRAGRRVHDQAGDHHRGDHDREIL